MSTNFESIASQSLTAAPAISPLEAALLQIWSDVLEVPEVGLHDDFFDLGGHSLLSIEIRARIKKALEVSFVRVDVLATPTVALMAQAIIEQLSAASAKAQDQTGVAS